MTLVLTGMAVFFAETLWAKFVVGMFGSPKAAAYVHRTAAAIMLGIFFLHLVYLAVRLVPRLGSYNWFGPTSLVPGRQDLKDIIAMFEWFFGRGPRPQFDRWTYWEKFDYWAVFWGMAIIGGSGFMLASRGDGVGATGLGVQRRHHRARRGSGARRGVPLHRALLLTISARTSSRSIR